MITPIRMNPQTRPLGRTGEARGPAPSAAGFSASGGAMASGQAAAARPMSSPAMLEALVALQLVDDPARRRARAARRGGVILDDLDALKLAVLEGRSGSDELLRLSRVLAATRDSSEDADLDDLIDAIELRAQVEIAKRER